MREIIQGHMCQHIVRTYLMSEYVQPCFFHSLSIEGPERRKERLGGMSRVCVISRELI